MAFDFSSGGGDYWEEGKRSLFTIAVEFKQAVDFVIVAKDWHRKRVGVFSCLSGEQNDSGLIMNARILFNIEYDKQDSVAFLFADKRVKKATLQLD